MVLGMQPGVTLLRPRMEEETDREEDGQAERRDAFLSGAVADAAVAAIDGQVAAVAASWTTRKRTRNPKKIGSKK